MHIFGLIMLQSLSHAFRKGGGAFGALAFYVIVMTLFAFALGPDGLHRYAGAVMCVAMVLASTTALPLLYERDHEDGTLEQYLLQPTALEWLALAKIAGHWVSIMGPMLTISPVMAMIANLSWEQSMVSITSLLLASLSVVAIGSLAAALTLGSKRGGLLQALITLPLTTPVLIFAASTSGEGALLFLGGIALALLPLSCFVSAALIRMSVD